MLRKSSIQGSLCLALGLIQGCQTAPPLTEDLRRAACASQQYLLQNGFLDIPPKNNRAVFISDADVEAHSTLGNIDYDRIVAGRLHQFSRKLLGVNKRMNFDGYLVVYRSEKRKAPERCVIVSSDFRIAYRGEAGCEAEKFVPLRERNLSC